MRSTRPEAQEVMIPVQVPADIVTEVKYTEDRIPTPVIPVLLPLGAVLDYPAGYVVRKKRGRPPKAEERLMVREGDLDRALGEVAIRATDGDPLVRSMSGGEDQVRRLARVRSELARECARLRVRREELTRLGKDIAPASAQRVWGLYGLAKLTIDMCRLGVSDPSTVGDERMARLRESWLSVVQVAAEDVLPEDVAARLMDRLRDEIAEAG